MFCLLFISDRGGEGTRRAMAAVCTGVKADGPRQPQIAPSITL